MQALAEPPFPEDLAYLHRWAHQLHGRCGVTSGVVLPVSHQEILAWSRLSGHRPDPLEVHALTTIDAVMRNPEPPKDEEPVVDRPVDVAWPTRKNG